LGKEAVLFQFVSDSFEIDRAKDSGVFGDFSQIRKSIPLTNLVGEKGKGGSFEGLTEIDRGVGGFGKECLATHPIFFLFVPEGTFDEEIIDERRHVGFAEFGGGIEDPETVGGHGVKARGVALLAFSQKILQELKLALEFVSEAKENHRGMIPISFDHTASLFPHPSYPFLISWSI